MNKEIKNMFCSAKINIEELNIYQKLMVPVQVSSVRVVHVILYWDEYNQSYAGKHQENTQNVQPLNSNQLTTTELEFKKPIRSGKNYHTGYKNKTLGLEKKYLNFCASK